jgi:hypothetical protein
LPTGEVEKVDGKGIEWLLSRGLAQARREGKRGKERKKRKEKKRGGKGLTVRLWVCSG